MFSSSKLEKLLIKLLKKLDAIDKRAGVDTVKSTQLWEEVQMLMRLQGKPRVMQTKVRDMISRKHRRQLEEQRNTLEIPETYEHYRVREC